MKKESIELKNLFLLFLIPLYTVYLYVDTQLYVLNETRPFEIKGIFLFSVFVLAITAATVIKNEKAASICAVFVHSLCLLSGVFGIEGQELWVYFLYYFPAVLFTLMIGKINNGTKTESKKDKSKKAKQFNHSAWNTIYRFYVVILSILYMCFLINGRCNFGVSVDGCFIYFVCLLAGLIGFILHFIKQKKTKNSNLDFFLCWIDLLISTMLGAALYLISVNSYSSGFVQISFPSFYCLSLLFDKSYRSNKNTNVRSQGGGSSK